MHTDPKIETVWVTRYALSKGVIVYKNVEHCLSSAPDGNMISLGPCHTMHGKDWHRSLEAALARVEEMKISRRAAIAKELKKLDKPVPIIEPGGDRG